MSEFRMAEFGSSRQYGNGAVEERPPYAEISSGTCAVINTQPTYNPQGHPRSRPIIPVAIVGNQQPQNQPEFQRAGIDVLGIADEIYVQQTVELLDLVAAVESENRYLIKVPRGDTIFEVAEKSSGCQRAVIGAARSFVLMIFDRSRNEVLRIYRMAACTCCFMYCCCLQNVEVYSPHSNLLGSIRQEWSMLIPTFTVRNAAGDRIYRIEGPSTFMFCVNMEDSFKMVKGKKEYVVKRLVPFLVPRQHQSMLPTLREVMKYSRIVHNIFRPENARKEPTVYEEASRVARKIMSCDGTRIVGSISNIWNDVQAQHNLHVVFPQEEGTQMKAVLLGAAFLLQYMFFERSKRASRIRLNRFTQ